MANRAHVPQFGKWDTQEVPYTVYFDKARKGRGTTPGGKMINPNDPSENPEMFAPPPPAASPPPQPRTRPQTPVNPQPEPRQQRREEANFRQYESPARNDNLSRRSEQGYQNSPINRGGRTARANAGSTENSFDRSPMHPQPGKSTGRGSASPAWGEGKNSYDSSHGGSGSGSGGGSGGGKSRMKPIPGDESPDGSAAVPRFGDWDENNPQSADNYTHIFNKVRDERHNPVSNDGGGNRTPRRRYPENVSSSRQGCCFPWLGK